MKVSIVTVGCVGLIAALAVPASGQVIQGKVIGNNDVRVDGAKVRIVSSDGHLADLLTTNAEGTYKSGALAAGTFTVSVSAGGYDGLQRSVTLAAAGEVRQDFVLKERLFLIQTGPRSGLDVTLAQPGTFTFFDVGTDDEGEVDLFADGKLNATIQLIGADLIGWTDRSQRIRVGGNFGFGLGTAKEPAPTAADPKATKDSSAVFLSAAGIVDFAKVVRFEFGWVKGISAREAGTLDQQTDSALFVGLSLRTQLGDQFMKIFR